MTAEERQRRFEEQQQQRAASLAQVEENEERDRAERLAEAVERARRAEASLEQSPAVQQQSAKLQADLQRKRDADKQYAQMLEKRQRLPSWEYAESLVETIRGNQVTVVAGETGCGKTTQLPQFLLDAAIDAGQGARINILCTQPRRISATSVAARVAAERSEPLGQTVGYQIRLEAVRSAKTRVCFMTTGVLLRRLSEDPLLAGVSHVIVDEVHERSLDSDFLLVLLRDLLPHRPNLRIVLMSATLNAAAFSRYFTGAAVREIPGFTHPVQDWFLEDVLQMTGYAPSPGSEYIVKSGRGGATKNLSPEQARSFEDFISELPARGYTKEAISALLTLDQEKINYELMETLIAHICNKGEEGAILVFLPGLMEIAKLHELCAASHRAPLNAEHRGAKSHLRAAPLRNAQDCHRDQHRRNFHHD